MRLPLSLVTLGFAAQMGEAMDAKKAQLGQEIAKQVVTQAVQQNQGNIKNLLQSGSSAVAHGDSNTLDINFKEPLVIDFRESPQTVNLLPGVFHLQKGFNAYKGVPFFEGAQSDKDVFTFTFDEGKGTSGDTGYLVPDQMDIPPLSYMCIYSDRASEVMQGDSTEFMEAYSSSVSKESAYSAEVGGASAAASVSASYSSANSSAREASHAARSESKTKQMTTSVIATLYTFALKQGLEQSFLSEDFKSDLAKVKDNESAFRFISTYGSHYLKKAKMGARYQENVYFSEDATEEQMSQAQSDASSNSFAISASVSASGFGVSAGVSTSQKQEKSSENNSSSSSSSSYSESTSRGGIRQFGQIAASGKCGDLVGTDNILFPVEYETEPIYKIVSASEYPKQRVLLEKLLKTMVEQGVECAKERCSNRGTCVVDRYFFEKDFEDLSYEHIFRKDPCVCDHDRMGHDCSVEYDPSAILEAEKRADKLANWTKYEYSHASSFKQLFANRNSNGKKALTFVNKSDSNWAVLPTYFIDQNWKNAVSSYATYVLAINSYEAHARKIITHAKDWEKVGTFKLDLTVPVCPQGYLRTSAYARYHDDSDELEKFKNGNHHIHCLKEEYWITQSAAKKKYGISSILNESVQEHCSACTTQKYTNQLYMTVPKEFAYKGEFAEFDMSYNSNILYPAHLNKDKTMGQKLIDFAHPHFYFHGEYKDFAQAAEHFK